MGSIEKVKLSLNEHANDFVKQLAILFAYDLPADVDVRKLFKNKKRSNFSYKIKKKIYFIQKLKKIKKI
jgi:hypothetical protein